MKIWIKYIVFNSKLFAYPSARIFQPFYASSLTSAQAFQKYWGGVIKEAK